MKKVLNNFNEDLEKVIRCRSYPLAERIVKSSFLFEKAMDPLLEKLKKKTKLSGLNEQDRLGQVLEDLRIIGYDKYKKRFKDYDKLLRIIDWAKSGNNRKLIELIKFDKTWLVLDWVTLRIIDEQYKENRGFFNLLSDAMKIKLSSRNRARSSLEEKVHSFLECLSFQFHYIVIKNETKFKRQLFDLTHYSLFEKNIFQLSEEELLSLDKLNYLNGEHYFYQYLKRHNLFIKRELRN